MTPVVIVEVLLVGGVVFGFGFWQLWQLRKDRQRREREERDRAG